MPPPSSDQPRRPALQRAPSTATGDKPSKAVQIADPETTQFAEATTWPPAEPSSKKQFRAGLGDRRLSGRMPSSSTVSTTPSTAATAATPVPSTPITLTMESPITPVAPGAISPFDEIAPGTKTPQSSKHRIPKSAERLLAQVAEWLEHEKNKAERRKHVAKKVIKRRPPRSGASEVETQVAEQPQGRQRSSSIDSQGSNVSLDRLQRIIEEGVSALGLSSVPSFTPRLGRRPSRRRIIHRTNSSDTEYHEGDVIVPSCDGVLDVSKTLAYSGGQASSSTLAVDALSTTTVESTSSKKNKEKERQAWTSFKNEIIRLTHTLKLKGWRRVPLDAGDSISVSRISGALTNAVYMVSPPTDLPIDAAASPTITPLRKQPPKLLLRVYGPQVENLIDRETELAVLRRLARKRIGPRLLGTFENGRFEEFFNAITLRPQNLREPETSKQIAKRMRELHLGIDLLPSERLGGPAVFRNWDKWVDNVETSAMALDQKYEKSVKEGAPLEGWMKTGYVCGAEWPKFREMVKKHREFVEQAYGSKEALQESLVFCHNDTQYGNILRIEPDNQKSPLLQPANKHKQLVVIDFEYAAANVAGLDIANHFTEWTYNYHDPLASHACTTSLFPSKEEQLRFIRAYVDHEPEFPHTGTTPRMTPLDSMVDTPGAGSAAGSIKEFMLDARTGTGSTGANGVNSLGMNNSLAGVSREDLFSLDPSAAPYNEAREKRVSELMDEAILWRAANSAQWVAWGIVQAKMPEEQGAEKADSEDDEDEQFDYLGYAQDRALFFWGDCVVLGLITEEELPESVRGQVKIVRK